MDCGVWKCKKYMSDWLILLNQSGQYNYYKILIKYIPIYFFLYTPQKQAIDLTMNKM